MCYFLFHRKSMTALEKDPKKYVEERFRWLQEQGYHLRYSFRNGEHGFWFDDPRTEVYLYYDDLDAVACWIGCGKPRHDRSISAFLDEAEQDHYDQSSAKGKIDFLSEKLKEILGTLDGEA